MILMLLFMAATSIIGLRLLSMGLFGLGHWNSAGQEGFTPPRADIVDRNGDVLARTIDAWSIGIHPNKLLNTADNLAPKLATLMPERTVDQYKVLLKSGQNFTYLRRRALPALVAQVNALGEPAVDFVREPERLYPQTTLAAHVLGYTNFDGNGVAGMERVLNARLTDPAQRNTPVMLSLDNRVQGALESELTAGMVKHQAKGAAGLVMDVETGEILALASLPVFNPNKSGQASDDARRNNMTQSVYELGSTFKPLIFADALETHSVPSLSRRYNATAPLQVGEFTIHDDEPAGRWLNLPEALVQSSNIVTAQVADKLGKQEEMNLFRRLHFDSPPQIELVEKGRPIWPRIWGRATVMTVGYGHGISITPLHLASAYAALVNGGIWRPTTLLKAEPSKPVAGARVFSEETSATLRKMLRLVVLKGTGGKANVDGMRVGGKTGTAEIAGKGGYQKHSLISTFASAFPMDHPRYIVLCMLDQPHGTADTGGAATAGMVSAPIAGKVIARIGPMLGIVPNTQADIDVSDMLPLLWHPKDKN